VGAGRVTPRKHFDTDKKRPPSHARKTRQERPHHAGHITTVGRTGSESGGLVPATPDTTRLRVRTISDWLLPRFDETTLFLLAVSCIWILASPSGLLPDLIEAVEGEGMGVWLFLILLWSAVGLGLSVFHAFATREKTAVEKTSMAVFAMTTNAAAGIIVGIGRLNAQPGPARALAIVNFAAVIVLAYQVGLAQDRVVSDEDATLNEVIPGFVLIAALFIVCELVMRLPWPVTFSLCVSYSSWAHRSVALVSRSVYGLAGLGRSA